MSVLGVSIDDEPIATNLDMGHLARDWYRFPKVLTCEKGDLEFDYQ
jgi:hypothetical protein